MTDLVLMAILTITLATALQAFLTWALGAQDSTD